MHDPWVKDSGPKIFYESQITTFESLVVSQLIPLTESNFTIYFTTQWTKNWYNGIPYLNHYEYVLYEYVSL